MRSQKHRNLIENLEARRLLAVNVAAGALYTTDDGARAIRMNWQGQEQKALANWWVLQLDGYSGYLPTQASKAAPLMTKAGSAFRLDHHLGANGLFSVYVPTSITPEETLRRFAKNPGFRSAQPDFLYETQLTPNDTDYGTEWGLNNTGQTVGGVVGVADADIDAPEAWDITTGSSSTVVGMIDSGISYNHPDLAANVWINPGETAGDGIDNDGNGYIDDIRGWDFWGNGGSPGAGDSDPLDQNNHGTHTAGTVGAVSNNSLGVTGVNWNVKMIALKIGGAGSSVSGSAAVAAMNYVLNMKQNFGVNVRVTNHSWGGGGFDSNMNAAITAHQNAGIIMVCAAGNNGSNNDTSAFYPASYSQTNIISVGNLTNTNARNSGSNYGVTTVDLFAPGTNVNSTIIGNTYALFTGTSMAAPHVTGVVALCFSVNPNATYQQVRDAIYQNVENVPSLVTRCVTSGRLSADGAVAQMLATLVPAIPSQPDLGTGSDSGVSNSDNNTNVTTPTFTGTATAGTYIRIFANAVEVGNGIAAGGSYSITTSALTNGVNSITATAATDGVSTQSAASSALAVNIDTIAPTLVGGVPSFVYATSPHKIVYSFSEDVSATLGNADVAVTKLPATGIATAFSYNGGLNQGTFDLGGVLADGDYTSALNGAGVTDLAGNAMANNNFPFFFMMADFNHDRFVNANDFTILAGNFGQSGKNFTQGDANYDGTVNANDFTVLASRFGTSLASTAGSRSTLPADSKTSPFGDSVIGDDDLAGLLA